MLSRASQVLDALISVMAVLAGLLILASMATVLAEVVMRYFLGRPLVWVVEYNEYLLLYLTFLAAPWVLREEAHVTVDLLQNALGARPRALLQAFASLIGALVCVAITVYGWEVTVNFIQRGVRNSTLLAVPKGPIVAVIPVGGLLLFLQFCRRLARALVQWQALGRPGLPAGSQGRGES